MSEFEDIRKQFKVYFVYEKELPTGAYGVTYCERGEIYIKKELPECVKKSVIAHEFQHEKDCGKGYNRFVRELRANIAGMKHPIGFITCVVMSLFSISRWKMYMSLIFGKERK